MVDLQAFAVMPLTNWGMDDQSSKLNLVIMNSAQNQIVSKLLQCISSNLLAVYAMTFFQGCIHFMNRGTSVL